MGVILNDGMRLPTLRSDDLHFATATPHETRTRRVQERERRGSPSLPAHDGVAVSAGSADLFPEPLPKVLG